MSQRRTASSKPKLSVYTSKVLIKRLREEKVETERTLEDIVNSRLLLSYEAHPGPLYEVESA
jgi:hypothetical protein